MSREVRRVPLDWEHPKSTDVPWAKGKPTPIPLHPFENFPSRMADYEADPEDYADYGPPTLDQHMPDFSHVPEDQLGWCMYETTTEGTPISPVCKTPEELAHWLAETGASAWAGQTTSYSAWLNTIRQGSSVGAYFSPSTGIISGVEAEHRFKDGEL